MKLKTTLVTFLLLILSCLSQAALAAVKVTPEASYIFTQFAKTAVLTPVNIATGKYRLTLAKVPTTVRIMSDRPERISREIPIEKYLAIWSQGNNSFDTTPPNVEINGTKIHAIFFKTQLALVMELSNPQYDAKTHSITYAATIFDQRKPTQPITLHDVTLFIDSGMCPSCCCI